MDTQLQADFDAVLEAFKEKEAAVVAQRAILAEKLKEFLKNYVATTDTLKGIKWTQYTPYFMDGDPCEFCVNEVYAQFDDTPEEAGDYEDGYICSYDCYDYKDGEKIYTEEGKRNSTIIEDIQKIFSDVSDDVFLDAFGDHAQIVVSADDVDIDEYDHH